MVDYTNDVADNERRLQTLTDYARQKQAATGVKLLWGTANLFSHRALHERRGHQPRRRTCFAYAAAQVKKAMEVTISCWAARTTCSGAGARAT